MLTRKHQETVEFEQEEMVGAHETKQFYSG